MILLSYDPIINGEPISALENSAVNDYFPSAFTIMYKEITS